MKHFLAILLTLFTWMVIAAYVLVVTRYTRTERGGAFCHQIDVVVKDSAQMSFITPGMVRLWFNQEMKDIFRPEAAGINTCEVERFIRRRGFVKDVRVYTTFDGVLHIELTQRRPVARVCSANGYNFYITEDSYILPIQRHEVVYVPVITGMLFPPFERGFVGNLEEVAKSEKKASENYVFLTNLINFVKFVKGDEFWNSFAIQIDIQRGGAEVGSDPTIHIVPRVGNQVVVLGSLDGYPEKLARLMSFYRNGASYEGWSAHNSINVQYTGQVICSR